jgi:hypothetical protein
MTRHIVARTTEIRPAARSSALMAATSSCSTSTAVLRAAQSLSARRRAARQGGVRGLADLAGARVYQRSRSCCCAAAWLGVRHAHRAILVDPSASKCGPIRGRRGHEALAKGPVAETFPVHVEDHRRDVSGGLSSNPKDLSAREAVSRPRQSPSATISAAITIDLRHTINRLPDAAAGASDAWWATHRRTTWQLP